MYPAVFMDRDNTLIEDMGYSAEPDRVRLRPGAAECVQRFRHAGYYVIVVTNQSGVARGYFSEEQLAATHKRMQELLLAHGTGVDAVYYCPFLDGPEAAVAAYRRESDLRKPKPGMLLQAADELKVDLGASWMIGDAQRDVEAGRAAGCRTILLGGSSTDRAPPANFSARDLLAAADIILSNGSSAALRPAVSPERTADCSREEPQMTQMAQIKRHLRESAPSAVSHEGRPEQHADATAELLQEVRQWRREARSNDYGTAHLFGAIAQVFALGGLFWGLYAIFDPNKGDAMVRLMAAAVFQLIALTYLRMRP